MGKKSEKAFSDMFYAYSDDIYRFVYWRCGEEEKAQDITSEVFSRAWQNWENFDGTYPKAWLYRIAKNLLIDMYRKPVEEAIDEDDQPASEHTMEDDVDATLVRIRLHKALGRLPEKERLVVDLRILQRFSAKETGDILGLSEQNVRVVQFRALKRLGKFYEEK